MTRRDLAWKVGGFGLTAVSTALCLALEAPAATIILFPLALLGLPLMIHGKRVGQVFRAEYRGHQNTAGAVHAARVRQRGQSTDGFGH
jgi:hypothetical protein